MNIFWSELLCLISHLVALLPFPFQVQLGSARLIKGNCGSICCSIFIFIFYFFLGKQNFELAVRTLPSVTPFQYRCKSRTTNWVWNKILPLITGGDCLILYIHQPGCGYLSHLAFFFGFFVFLAGYVILPLLQALDTFSTWQQSHNTKLRKSTGEIEIAHNTHLRIHPLLELYLHFIFYLQW